MSNTRRFIAVAGTLLTLMLAPVFSSCTQVSGSPWAAVGMDWTAIWIAAMLGSLLIHGLCDHAPRGQNLALRCLGAFALTSPGALVIWFFYLSGAAWFPNERMLP